MYALSVGMGFSGAYISGQGLPYESVEYIISRGKEMSTDWQQWLSDFNYPQEKGFYLFEKDFKTGLNSETLSSRIQKPARPLIYMLSIVLHEMVFEPKSVGFKIMKALAPIIDSSHFLRKIFHALEYWTKSALYGCKDCGDCALNDVAYLCPVSQCPKDQRNAPCGGSYHGWCEVYPGEKQCIWVRAYQRLKSRHQEYSISSHVVPPCNWELWQTSSWLNYFQGRDHISQRVGIKRKSN
jgi:methylenetetrahydrofolate reductase (NADPH)